MTADQQLENGLACAARKVFLNTTDPAAKDRYQPWEELIPLQQEGWINVVRFIQEKTRETVTVPEGWCQWCGKPFMNCDCASIKSEKS